VQWRRRRVGVVEDGGGDGDGDGGGASYCSSAPLLDWLARVSVGEGVGGAVNLVLSAPAPHLYLLWRCTVGAHQPMKGWAPPIRVRIKGLICCWAY